MYKNRSRTDLYLCNTLDNLIISIQIAIMRKEIRIDCSNQNTQDLERTKEQAKLIFRFNHTMPMTEEQDEY